MNNTYIYVYQTICEANGKSYVGVHKTKNINDGYIGCGIRGESNIYKKNKTKSKFHNAVRKYGYANFTKHILSFYDNYEDALSEERYIVNENWVKDNSNYNMAIGGNGYMFADLPKKEISDKYKGIKNHRYGKAALNRKPVIQYSLKNEIIKKYESLTQASNYLQIEATNITNSCKGKYTQTGGFIFRYETYTPKEQVEYNLNIGKRSRIYNSDGSWVMDKSKLPKVTHINGMLGKSHKKESKIKMSLSRTGVKRKPHSELTKRKIGEANRIIQKIKKQNNIDCR